MMFKTLVLPLTLILSLNACSGDKNLEDPIQAIQNAQQMRDALDGKSRRDLKVEPSVEAIVSYPLKKKTTQPAFQVDDISGKVQFQTEIVYFEYDDSTLTKEGMQHLNALAEYLKDHDATKLNIEGHCDSRGSVEYNLALGQRRSESVKKYLATLSIPENRLDTRSFGKEKPAAEGQSEAALAKNRRVEFAFSLAH
ncbi:MAG: peptidoglycan-associated lipoprotein [Proteobacteria bacterium]|nr:MAG: peptidoglycan-associated lipoprotein [Pseudomonadota bacterium]